MREIKFRGRRLDNGEWVHGNLITPTFDNSNIIFGYYIYEMNKTNYFSRGESKLEDFYEMPLVGVDPKTVGQLTGLTDRNGKEIYEGDIVKQVYHAEAGSYDDRMSFDGHHIGEVVITARKGVCMRNPFCYAEETDETTKSNQYKNVAGYRCEVVGNIYEKTELMKVSA